MTETSARNPGSSHNGRNDLPNLRLLLGRRPQAWVQRAKPRCIRGTRPIRQRLPARFAAGSEADI